MFLKFNTWHVSTSFNIYRKKTLNTYVLVLTFKEKTSNMYFHLFVFSHLILFSNNPLVLQSEENGTRYINGNTWHTSFCVWNVETGAWLMFCNDGDREPPCDGATGMGRLSMSTSSSCISGEERVSVPVRSRWPELGAKSESWGNGHNSDFNTG